MIQTVKHIVRQLLSPAFYKELPTILVKNSYWYHSIFPDSERISKVTFGNQILCFGSNPGKYALDFSECGIKAYNLSIGPETLEYDFNMLKNFHSYLDENGKRIVIITLCPMSLCKKEYEEKDGMTYLNYRYYPFLHRAFLPDFDKKFYQDYVLNPKSLLKKYRKNILLSYLLKDKFSYSNNPLNSKQMVASAKCYIESWSHEFEWNDLSLDFVPDKVKGALDYNMNVLMNMDKFCKDRNIKLRVILPPLSPYIRQYFTAKFRNEFIYNVLDKAGIPYMDYMDSDVFTHDKYYVDALLLNANGRRLFAREIVSKLI